MTLFDTEFENQAIELIKKFARLAEKMGFVPVLGFSGNKEYYETNRKTTLNWILRLIDECCESISIQKGNKL